MPIYEYRCQRCRKLETLFVRSFAAAAEAAAPVCSRCGSADVRKVPSRFVSPRSDDARAEALADPSALAGLDENDPRALARWAKQLARESGEDYGDDMREMIDMLEAGQLPDDDGGAEGAADDFDSTGLSAESWSAPPDLAETAEGAEAELS